MKHLIPGSKIVSDGLGCFRVFEEIGFEHTTIVTGGGPESVKTPDFKWINTIIGNVKKSIHGTFHAISKKHFSRYLGEFCYRFNRRFDLAQDDTTIWIYCSKDSANAVPPSQTGGASLVIRI